MNDYVLYIPTRGRIDHQPTYDFWSNVPEVEDNMVLVCREDEAREHVKRGRNVLIRPSNLPIHGVWEWLKNTTKEPKFLIMDDDLKFYRRKSPIDWRLRDCDYEDGAELLDFALNSISWDKWAHGTLSSRQGNNNRDAPYEQVGRANAFHFFDTELLQSVDLDMSETGLHDIHTTLTLLRLGYPNLVITEFCWNQTRGTNAPGGCSIYRDKQWQHDEVMKLKELHPEFLSVMEKKPKGGWGQGMDTRTDVRVKWQKAFESSGGTLV